MIQLIKKYDEEEELDLKMINLWEDALSFILKKPMTVINLPNIAILYEFSVAGLFLELGLEPAVFYPIMRINGFKSLSDITYNSANIYIPQDINLMDIREQLLKKGEI